MTDNKAREKKFSRYSVGALAFGSSSRLTGAEAIVKPCMSGVVSILQSSFLPFCTVIYHGRSAMQEKS